MARVTTDQHYEMPGGTLRLVLTTDHPLTHEEREDLDRIATACTAFQRNHDVLGHRASREGVDDIDEAIWELGGDEAISAG
jgi:hypothetical protein